MNVLLDDLVLVVNLLISVMDTNPTTITFVVNMVSVLEIIHVSVIRAIMDIDAVARDHLLHVVENIIHYQQIIQMCVMDMVNVLMMTFVYVKKDGVDRIVLTQQQITLVEESHQITHIHVVVRGDV